MNKKTNKAFTLIELLVVIAIIGILSGFIFVSMNSAITASKDAKRKADIAAIAKAISMYSAQNGGVLPSTGTSCDVCNGCAGACANLYTNISPYLTSIPTDPNGTTVYYKYTYSATLPSFTLQSTLSNGYTYRFDSSTDGFSTITPWASTCGATTNAQVSCTPVTISSTEEACQCTYLSGAGTTNWTVPTGVTSVQYLVVGGGGGGGFMGGGGGGGVLQGTFTITNQVYSIMVGAGGASNGGNSHAAYNGSNSVFATTIIAIGGGAGGIHQTNGSSGGSGGGGGINDTLSDPHYGGGGTSGQGYAGGNTPSTACGPCGGGGGSNGVGGSPYSGGNGTSSSITGISTFYGGGGGGGSWCASYGAGGLGGGGNGAVQGTGQPGTDGLGGGGGGATNSGKGGSGVVIIRYLHP